VSPGELPLNLPSPECYAPQSRVLEKSPREASSTMRSLAEKSACFHLPPESANRGWSGIVGFGIDGRRLKVNLSDGPGQGFRRSISLLKGVVHSADLNQDAPRRKGLVVL